MKESKKIFFAETIQKKKNNIELILIILGQKNVQKYKQKKQRTAMRNDISFSFQKLSFHFQICQLCPKIARPECFIKLPPADLTQS